MLRLRVYRLQQPLTVLGLELWQLATLGGGFLLAMEFSQAVFRSGPVALLASAASGFGLMRAVEAIQARLVPGFIRDYVAWVSGADVYWPQADPITAPLVVDVEERGKDAAA